MDLISFHLYGALSEGYEEKRNWMVLHCMNLSQVSFTNKESKLF